MNSFSIRHRVINACGNTNSHTCGQELHHLILTLAGDVIPEGFVYSLCQLTGQDQVTIPTLHYGFEYIE